MKNGWSYRLENYVDSKNKKVAILLSSCGVKTYLLKGLKTSVRPVAKKV